MLLILLLLQIVLVSSGELEHPNKPAGPVVDILGCAIYHLWYVKKETDPGYATESFNHILYNLT